MRFGILYVLTLVSVAAFAQEQDSIKTKKLSEVVVKDSRLTAGVNRLPDLQGTSLQVSEQLSLKLNINNITNEKYFTKRPSFYPGPGVWSSDGRSMKI